MKHGPLLGWRQAPLQSASFLDLLFAAAGLRVTVPDLHDLFIEERNRRIRAEFTGNNYEELALRFTSRTGTHLSVRQIRYIIDGERGPGKKS